MLFCGFVHGRRHVLVFGWMDQRMTQLLCTQVPDKACHRALLESHCNEATVSQLLACAKCSGEMRSFLLLYIPVVGNGVWEHCYLKPVLLLDRLLSAHTPWVQSSGSQD